MCVCVVSRCVCQAKTRPPAMPHTANEKIARDTVRKILAAWKQTYARTNKSVSRKVGLYVADAACRLLIRMSWRNPIDPTTRCDGMALKASDFDMKAVAEFEASGFLDPALRPGWLDTNPWEEDPWLEAAATKDSSEERWQCRRCDGKKMAMQPKSKAKAAMPAIKPKNKAHAVPEVTGEEERQARVRRGPQPPMNPPTAAERQEAETIDAGAMRWADLADDERFQWCLHPKVKASSKAVYIQVKETRRMMREDVDVDAPMHLSVSPVSLSESKANADQSANALGNSKMRRAAKSNEFRETMLMRDEDVDESLLLCAWVCLVVVYIGCSLPCETRRQSPRARRQTPRLLRPEEQRHALKI